MSKHICGMNCKYSEIHVINIKTKKWDNVYTVICNNECKEKEKEKEKEDGKNVSTSSATRPRLYSPPSNCFFPSVASKNGGKKNNIIIIWRYSNTMNCHNNYKKKKNILVRIYETLERDSNNNIINSVMWWKEVPRKKKYNSTRD